MKRNKEQRESLKEAVRASEALRTTILVMKANIAELEEIILELLHVEHPEVEFWHDLELGIHECAESPTGRCYYDAIKDPMKDHCLVCGCPHERK